MNLHSEKINKLSAYLDFLSAASNDEEVCDKGLHVGINQAVKMLKEIKLALQKCA